MIRSLKITACAAALVALAACGNNEGGAPGSQKARAGIWAAGSSTVFPFATRVAENYARRPGRQGPQGRKPGHRRRHQAVLLAAPATASPTSPTPRVR